MKFIYYYILKNKENMKELLENKKLLKILIKNLDKESIILDESLLIILELAKSKEAVYEIKKSTPKYIQKIFRTFFKHFQEHDIL
jgi:hypothetical protein